jgi:hypothetical protein
MYRSASGVVDAEHRRAETRLSIQFVLVTRLF